MRRKSISRENAVRKILNSNGKMFTVSWTKKNGELRKLNGKFVRRSGDRRNQDKIFGYLTVFDPHNGGTRRVDTRNIKELAIEKQRFLVR